ncbi:MAG: 30S ribosomal protein S12 methylthiotransferase RimO [Armatimonadota bacterium]
MLGIMDKARIGLVSLGCPKNLVDSEEMLGALIGTGRAEMVDPSADSDVLVVNTCAFIDSAKQESIDAILEAVERKRRGEVGKVLVAGCLAQRYGADLERDIPEVDAFVGVQSAPRIADLVFGAGTVRGGGATLLPMAGNQVAPLPEKYPLVPPRRVRATAPWTAYLKVSEGCDHGCTFCAIPKFRGRHRSKPIEHVLDEARRLVDAGAVEINLIAQDTTAYGMDLYRELALPRLLEGLGAIPGLRWVRLLYCYPTMVTDRLVRTMADTGNVVRYLDLPLQHGDDGMLSRMKRGGTVSTYYRLFDRLRSAMPDIALRTTFLVGFPGEDEASFAQLERFVDAARFDRLGVFEYSPEDGTPGAAMRPVVSRRTAADRRRRLMLRQQAISEQLNSALVGRTLEVLVESREGGRWVGRTWRDAPEIDGVVRFSGEGLRVGNYARVRIDEAGPYDVAGSVDPAEDARRAEFGAAMSEGRPTAAPTGG